VREHGGSGESLPHQSTTKHGSICATTSTDRIIKNHNGFFLVTVQIEAAAIVTLKCHIRSRNAASDG
jgi:hypothetical protein